VELRVLVNLGICLARAFLVEAPIKVLLSRDDELHKRGYYIIAAALRDAGIEVILGGCQIPREIAETALQEDVDIIGYHIMQGAPKILVPLLFEKLKEKGLRDLPVVVGGIIPAKDVPLLEELGVKEIFPSLTPLKEIMDFFKKLGREGNG
jgi:methylmalonyl-CoA mutase C-terminal domain/subunit